MSSGEEQHFFCHNSSNTMKNVDVVYGETYEAQINFYWLGEEKTVFVSRVGHDLA